MRFININFARKWGYAEYLLVGAVPGLLYFSFIMLNFIGTNARTISGTIISEENDWTLKHSYRCIINIDTELGRVNSIYYGQCTHEFGTGDKVFLDVMVGRLTGKLIVRQNTIHRDYKR